MPLRYILPLALFLLQQGQCPGADRDRPEFSAAGRDGPFILHTVKSAYQAGTTKIRVLLPSKVEKNRLYRVLYVLPVEALDGERWGNGLETVRRAGLHDKHGLICVAPTFSHLPWYADHPDDPRIRQESYLTRIVLPFIEKTYPATEGKKGRLLVGFSKSGWGAFTLLLRNPDLFAAAAAFDAPLALDKPGPFGTGPIFGGRENFEKYRVESLLKKNAGRRGSSKRLALLGHFVNFRKQHEKARSWMNSLKIQHHWHKGQRWKHSWESGWLPRAIELIAGDDKVQPEGNQLRE